MAQGFLYGSTAGENVTAEVSEYSSLLTDLEETINALPDAGSSMEGTKMEWYDVAALPTTYEPGAPGAGAFTTAYLALQSRPILLLSFVNGYADTLLTYINNEYRTDMNNGDCTVLYQTEVEGEYVFSVTHIGSGEILVVYDEPVGGGN